MTVGLATAACKSLCNTSRYGWGTLRSCVEEHLPTVTRPRLEKRVRGSSTNLLDAGRKIPQQYVATELLRHVTLAFQVSTSSEAVHVSEEPRESGDGWNHTLPGRCLFRKSLLSPGHPQSVVLCRAHCTCRFGQVNTAKSGFFFVLGTLLIIEKYFAS
jgi:hypothetical protein